MTVNRVMLSGADSFERKQRTFNPPTQKNKQTENTHTCPSHEVHTKYSFGGLGKQKVSLQILNKSLGSRGSWGPVGQHMAHL